MTLVPVHRMRSTSVFSSAIMSRETIKLWLPAPVLSAYRALLQNYWQRRMLKGMNPHARELYRRSQLTSYDSVRLPEDVEAARNRVGAAARDIYGEKWNFYSDALRPEIVEGFAKTIDALNGRDGGIDYLEIGSCQGLSLTLISLLLRDRNQFGAAVSVDPYFEQGYDEGETGPYAQRLHVQIDKQTKSCAFRLYSAFDIPVELVEAPSVEGLRTLIKADRRFDLIYIDGSHERFWPAADFGMCCALLRRDGIIILDDHLWPDVEPIKQLCDKYGEVIQTTWKTASYRINLDG
jgi:predicted O-methyltransferase YrrM